MYIALNRFVVRSELAGHSPPPLIIALLLLVCSVILLWQAVGAFRSATNVITRYGSSASYYGVLAVVLISCTFILGSFVTLSAGFIDYQQQAVDAYKPPKPNFKIISSSTSGLIFDGDIDRGATKALRKAAQSLPAETRLSLNSMGGLIVEARGMANVVNEFGLSTRVVQRCYSACTLVFIAGAQRSLGEQAELGFHQYDVYSQSPLPWIVPEEEQEKDLKRFRDKQVADWFLEKAYNTPHESIWVPLRDELVSAGVVTPP